MVPINKFKKTLESINGNKDGDSDLLSLVTRRLTKAEEELSRCKKCLIEEIDKNKRKDEEIRKLQEELSSKTMIPSNDEDDDDDDKEDMMEKYRQMQAKICNTDKFLRDYGLIWVGNSSQWAKSNSSSRFMNFGQENVLFKFNPQKINFDDFLKRIEDLNILAREGETQLCYTSKGASFKMVECMPLSLFSDGMIVASGPFREYWQQSSQDFIKDIMDGFFPSELQIQYPDGVAFKVTDKRDMTFKSSQNMRKAFVGEGYRLGCKAKRAKSGTSVETKNKDGESKTNLSMTIPVTKGPSQTKLMNTNKKMKVIEVKNNYTPKNESQNSFNLKVRSIEGEIFHIKASLSCSSVNLYEVLDEFLESKGIGNDQKYDEYQILFRQASGCLKPLKVDKKLIKDHGITNNSVLYLQPIEFSDS